MLRHAAPNRRAKGLAEDMQNVERDCVSKGLASRAHDVHTIRSFRDFRIHRTVAMSTAAALIIAGLMMAVLYQAVKAHTLLADLRTNMLYLGCFCIPAAIASRSSGSQAVFCLMIGFASVTLVDLLILLGWLPVNKAHYVLHEKRHELAADILASFHYQFDVPTMALLHGLRQTTRALLFIRRMRADVWSTALRCGSNWLVLIAVHSVYEAINRIMYNKAKANRTVHSTHVNSHQTAATACDSARPACSAEEPSTTKHANVTSSGASLRAVAAGNTSATAAKLPREVNCARNGGAATHAASTYHGAGSASHTVNHFLTRASGNNTHNTHALSPSGPRAAVTLVDATTGTRDVLLSSSSSLRDRTDNTCGVAPAAIPGLSAAASSAGSATVAASPRAAAAHGQLAATQAYVSNSVLQTNRIVLPGLSPMQRHVSLDAAFTRLAYARSSRHIKYKAYLKLKNLELQHLPPDFVVSFKRRLKLCMPGMYLVGVAVRQGCVVFALDFMSDRSLRGLPGSPNTDTLDGPSGIHPFVDGAASVVVAALKQCGVTRKLAPGAGLSIQSSHHVFNRRWDPAAQEFVVAELTDNSMHVLFDLAHQCQLQSVSPTIVMLPYQPQPSATDNPLQLQLKMLLTVPKHTRLLGWQPSGSAVSAEAQAVTFTPESVVAPTLDVMVLVRHQKGDYLPVVVRQAAHDDTTLACDSWTVPIVVDVNVPYVEASGLRVELWAKMPSPPEVSHEAAELLVAHCPVVMLSTQWRAAAWELEQHIDALGGVVPVPVLSKSNAGLATSDCSDRRLFAGLIDDLGEWLADMSSAASTLSTDPYAVAERDETGLSLLVYATRQGMLETAQLLVGTMAQCSKDISACSSSGCGSSITIDASGLLSPGSLLAAEWFQDVTRMSQPFDSTSSLLHAAVESCAVDMLEKVLRWGQVYGGSHWQWPWSAVNDEGVTVLHLVAAQPELDVCNAMLEMLRFMLPFSEVQAAQDVWLGSEGSVAATPAQFFAATHHTEYHWPRRSQGRSGSLNVASQPAVTASSSIAAVSSVNAPTLVGAQVVAPDDDECDTCLHTDTAAPAACTWALIRQAWRWKQHAEYNSWVLTQLSGTVLRGAWTLVIVGSVSPLRAWFDGTLRRELPHIVLHTAPYITIVAAANGNPRRGYWQVWTPIIPVLHYIGYLYMSLLQRGALTAVTTVIKTGMDHAYMGVIVSLLDQNPLLYIAISRLPMAWCQSRVWHSHGSHHPYLFSFIFYATTLLVCSLLRTNQLKNYYLWRCTNTNTKQVRASRSTSS